MLVNKYGESVVESKDHYVFKDDIYKELTFKIPPRTIMGDSYLIFVNDNGNGTNDYILLSNGRPTDELLNRYWPNKNKKTMN